MNKNNKRYVENKVNDSRNRLDRDMHNHLDKIKRCLGWTREQFSYSDSIHPPDVSILERLDKIEEHLGITIVKKVTPNKVVIKKRSKK